MNLNITLLTQSFELLAPHGDQLMTTFYENLFHDYPEVVSMFSDVNMADQKKKLLASLKLVVDNLRRPEVLAPALMQMGRKHAEFGTLDAHYPAVGATLLKSMAAVAGDHWNEQLERAWGEAYGAISELMMEGSKTLAAC